MTIRKPFANNAKGPLPRLFAALAIVLISIFVVQITSAYAFQLNSVELRLGIHNERSDFQPPKVALSHNFLGRLAESVSQDRARLLWSAYPASVRGQVFSSMVGGNDPLMNGGW